jgi:excisionase family DNA binding protein
MNLEPCYNAASPLEPGQRGHAQHGAVHRQSTLIQRTDTRDVGPAKKRQLVNIEELADRLAISKTGAYRLVARNALPFYRISGVLRFDVNEIEAFLRDNRVSS